MRGPTSSAAGAGTAGGTAGDGAGGGAGDNSETVLQRLVSDMQLLQSKLHLFNTHSSAPPNTGHSTATTLPSDDMAAKIDELKQRHDAEVLCTAVHH